MRYHNITHDDMNNGDGLRVVLWTAGCLHHCKGCQNPCTWDAEGGILFGEKEIKEIKDALSKSYISGITFSGGDPLHPNNRFEVDVLIEMIKRNYPTKTIWLYTGYTWEEICKNKELFPICSRCDVIIDGRYDEKLKDISLPWRGSSNQRVINVKETLKSKEIILHTN